MRGLGREGRDRWPRAARRGAAPPRVPPGPPLGCADRTSPLCAGLAHLMPVAASTRRGSCVGGRASRAVRGCWVPAAGTWPDPADTKGIPPQACALLRGPARTARRAGRPAAGAPAPGRGRAARGAPRADEGAARVGTPDPAQRPSRADAPRGRRGARRAGAERRAGVTERRAGVAEAPAGRSPPGGRQSGASSAGAAAEPASGQTSPRIGAPARRRGAALGPGLVACSSLGYDARRRRRHGGRREGSA